MQVKKQNLETNKEQKTGSKLGKEYVKAACCHPAYLTYMQSTSCDTPGSMKHTLESRLPGEIPMTSDSQMTPNLWQKTKYLNVKCQAGWCTSWNLYWREKYQQPDNSVMVESEEELKSLSLSLFFFFFPSELLDERERGEWKIRVETQHSRN